MTAASRLSDRVGRGARVAAWSLGQAARTSRVRAVAAIAVPTVGALLQAGALGLLLLVVRALVAEEDHLRIVRGVVAPISRDPAVVAMWVAAILVIYATASTAVYAGEALAYDLGRATARRLVRDGLERLRAAAGRLDPALASPAAGREFRRSMIGDAASIVRATMTILRLVVPAVWFVVSFVVLVAMNAGLTLVLAVVLGVLAVPIYRLTRDTVRASRAFEESRRVRGRRLGASIDALFWLRDPRGGADAAAALEAEDAPFDDLRRILLARRRVNLAREIAGGAAMALVIVAFSAVAAGSDADPAAAPRWPALLAYLVFLRASMVQLGSAARMLTSYSRFLPQLERVRRFAVDALRPVPVAADAAAATSPTIRVDAATLPGSVAALPLPEGGVVVLLTDADAHAPALPALLANLLGARDGAAVLAETALVGPIRAWGERPFDERLAGLDASACAELVAVLGAAWPEGASANATAERIGIESVRALGALGPALAGAARLVVCDLADLQGLGRPALAPLAAAIGERLARSRSTVLAVARGIPGSLPLPVAGAAALYDGRVIGAGDVEWLVALDPGALPRIAARTLDDGAFRDDDDDDDE